MDRIQFFGPVLAFVFSATSAFASVGDPARAGDLITRDAVTRLVQGGQVEASRVIDVRPADFVKLQCRASRVPEQKVAMLLIGGSMVIVCTGVLCAMISRDHLRNSQVHRDGSYEVGPPDGGW